MLREIVEGSVPKSKTQSRSRDILLHILDGDIPLSPKVLKFMEKPKKQYYFHSLNPAYITSLIKRQGKKQQISVFDTWKNDDIFSGADDLWIDNPIVAVLYGDYSFKFPVDAWTNYDKEGNRWIVSYNGFEEELEKVLVNIKEYTFKKMTRLFRLGVINFKENRFHYLTNSNNLDELFPRGTRTELIKSYFDNIYLAFKKYEKPLKKALSEKHNNSTSYNEIVAYNYKIIEFVIPERVKPYMYTSEYPEYTVKDNEGIDDRLRYYKRKNK